MTGTGPTPELPRLDEIPEVDLELVDGQILLLVEAADGRCASARLRPYQALALAAALVRVAHHPDIAPT